MAHSDLHRACGRNLALERQAQEQSRLIDDAGNRELDRIDRELKAIRPGLTLVDPSLAGRYVDLVNQRAQLLQSLG
ncbi:MAG: hypothetical protein ACJ75S_07045 [Solirubrobacterales bacterium]|jgi:hypothetical protein